jgi:hypothetical protein
MATHSSLPGDPGGVTLETITPDFGQAALEWFNFGLSVIPLLPGKKVTAVKWDRWLEPLSPDSIGAYWAEHPDHEVGCIVGDGLIVLDADTPVAGAALAKIEDAFDVSPAMVIRTRKGLHHYYRRGPGTFAKSDAHSTEAHPERIDVKTGRAMVVLPPSTGKEVEYMEVEHVEQLAEVGQGFIDAIFRHNGREAPRPPEPVTRPELAIEDLEGLCRQLAELINHLPPDMGYDDWLRVGMAVYHETGGSDEGLHIFDEWSSKGTKYPGYAEIVKKWTSFRGYVGEPITVRTIHKQLADRGLDWLDLLAAAESFTVIDPVEPQAPEEPLDQVPAHPLVRYSLKGMLPELQREVAQQTPLMGSLILQNQFSAIYGAPNSGKTLLTLRMVTDTIEAGVVDPGNIYYINVDDNYQGLMEKLAVAERFGFHMIASGFQGFTESNFLADVKQLIESDQAKGTIIILDTLKKFTNLMDKANSSSFTRAFRRFVLKGGTCVALAHVNKNRNASGKLVYAGTSDVVDDADCVYLLDVVGTDEDSETRTVEFENLKRRGDVVDRVAYRYSIALGQSYEALLASVCKVEDTEVAVTRQATVVRSNEVIIDAINSCIGEGVTMKMALVKEAATRAGVSQRTLMAILDQHTGRDPSLHRWTCTVGPRGAKIYEALPSQADAPL